MAGDFEEAFAAAPDAEDFSAAFDAAPDAEDFGAAFDAAPPAGNPVEDEAAFRNAYALTQPDEPAPVPSVHPMPEAQSVGRPANISVPMSPSIPRGAHAAEFGDMDPVAREATGKAYNAMLEKAQSYIRPFAEAEVASKDIAGKLRGIGLPNVGNAAELLQRQAMSSYAGDTTETMGKSRVESARSVMPSVNVPGMGETHPLEFAAEMGGNPLNPVLGAGAGQAARGALESLPAFQKLATATPRLAKVLAFTAEHGATGAEQGAVMGAVDPRTSIVEGAAGGAVLGPLGAAALHGVGAVAKPMLKLTGEAARGFYNDLQMGLRLYAEDAQEMGALFNLHAAVGDMLNPSGAMYAIDGDGRLVLQLYKITDGKMELTPPLPVENRAQADLAKKWLKSHGIRAVGASDEAKLKLGDVMTTEEITEQLAPVKVALQDGFDLPNLDMSGPAAKQGIGVPNEPQFDVDVTGKPYRKPMLKSREMTAMEQMDNAQTPDAVFRAGRRLADETPPPLPPDPDVAPEQIGDDISISIEQRPDGSAQITHAPEKPQPSVTAEKVRGKKGWLLKTITDSDGSQRSFMVAPDGTHTPVETSAPKPKRRIMKAAAPAPEPAPAPAPAPTPVEPVNPKSLTAEQRQALRDAGFKDSEIDKGYFDPKGLTGHVYTGGRMQPADDAYISQVRQDSGARVADAEEKLKQIQGKRGGLPPEEREALMGVDARENTYEEVRAELERRVEDGRQHIESRERQYERWKQANAAPAPVEAPAPKRRLTKKTPTIMEHQRATGKPFAQAAADVEQMRASAASETPEPKKPYSKPLLKGGRKEGPELPPFIEMERAQTPDEVFAAGKRLFEAESNSPANRPSREGLQAGDGTKESAARQPGPPAPSGPKRFAIKKNSDGTFRLIDKQAPGGRWRISNHATIGEAVDAAKAIVEKETAAAAPPAGPPKPPTNENSGSSSGPPGGPPKPEMPPEAMNQPLTPADAKRLAEAKKVAELVGMGGRRLFPRNRYEAKLLGLKALSLVMGHHHYGFQNLRDSRMGLKALQYIPAIREEFFRAVSQRLPRDQRGKLMLGDFGKDIQKFINNANDHLDWRDTDAYMQDHYPAAWPMVKDLALPAIEEMKRNSILLAQRFGKDPLTEGAEQKMRDLGLWDAYSTQIYWAHILKDDWAKILKQTDPNKLETAAKFLLDRFDTWLHEQKNLTPDELARYSQWGPSHAEAALRDILKTSNDIEETAAALRGHKVLGRAFDSVKSRQDIPEPIRQVLGPVDTALVRIPETLSRQRWLLHNINVWDNIIATDPRLVRDVGPTMGFSTQIPDNPYRYGNAAGKFIADEATDLIAASAKPPDLGPILGAMKVMARWSKAAMVPMGALKTWLANVFGNPYFMVLAGVNPWMHPRQTGRAFDMAWKIINELEHQNPLTTLRTPLGSVAGDRATFTKSLADRNVLMALRDEARTYGVDEPGLASIELTGKKNARLLNMVKQEMRKLPPDATYWDRMMVTSKVAETAGASAEEITSAYDSIDRTAKLMTYLYLREQGLKKFDGNVDSAAKWAARKIMDSFPSYTRMGRLVEGAAMAPGIFNFFVRFNTEVIRVNSLIPMRILGKGGRDADPGLIARLALAYGTVAGLGSAMNHWRRMNDISDEEANALVENRTTQDKAWRPLVWVTPFRKASNQQPVCIDLTQFWSPAKWLYGLPQDSELSTLAMNTAGAFTDNSLTGMAAQQIYEASGMTDPQWQPDPPEVQRTPQSVAGELFRDYVVPQGPLSLFREFGKTKEFGPRDPQTGELLMSPYTEPNTLEDAILRTTGIPSVPLSTGPNSPGLRAAMSEATQKGGKSIAREEQRIGKDRKLSEEEKTQQMEATPNTPRKLFFRQRAEDLTELNEKAMEAKQKGSTK